MEARIRLAREMQQKEAVFAELGNLVAVHQRRLKRVEKQVKDREVPGAEIEPIQIALLEAEIRLLKERR